MAGDFVIANQNYISGECIQLGLRKEVLRLTWIMTCDDDAEIGKILICFLIKMTTAADYGRLVPKILRAFTR